MVIQVEGRRYCREPQGWANLSDGLNYDPLLPEVSVEAELQAGSLGCFEACKVTLVGAGGVAKHSDHKTAQQPLWSCEHRLQKLWRDRNR